MKSLLLPRNLRRMAMHKTFLSAFESPHHQASLPGRHAVVTKVDAIEIPSSLLAQGAWILLISIAIFSVFLSGVARSQEAVAAKPAAPALEKPITLDPRLTDPGNVKKMTDAAVRFLRNDPAANEMFAKAYFSRYLPGILTDPQHSASIKTVLADLNKMLAGAASSRSEAVQAKTNQYVFGSLKPIAERNYSPQARAVAISVLARLDSKPLDMQAKLAPVPYQPTLTIFWNIIKEGQPADGVFAAALAAFHRHMMVSEGLPPQVMQAVRTRMNELLESEPPQDRSPEVHAYLQRYAIDVLDHLTQQKDPQLGSKLISIATDEKSLDLIAFHSAAKLGNLADLLKGKVENPELIMTSWSKRLLRTLESELARINAYDKPIPDRDQPRDPKDFLTVKQTETKKPTPMSRGPMEGMGGRGMEESMMEGMRGGAMGGPSMEDMQGMMEGMGPGMMGQFAVPEAKPQPAEVIAARKKINFALEYMNLGAVGSRALGLPKPARGIYAALPEDARAPVDKWITLSQAVSSALNDKSLDDRTKFREGLTAQIIYLREELGIVDEPGDGEQFEEVVGAKLAGDAPAEAGAAAAKPPAELDSEF
jgi:hypothetical protein